MPYVSSAEGLNQPFADLDVPLSAEMAWRTPLVATSDLRVVLLHWQPGYATVPHRHPHAAEIFIPLEGKAIFAIGNEPERAAGPGQLVLAERGVLHAIRVPADGGSLTLLAAVAPNEDMPDETVEWTVGSEMANRRRGHRTAKANQTSTGDRVPGEAVR
jgi:quercetin dioxygenase-like cupin family protein